MILCVCENYYAGDACPHTRGDDPTVYSSTLNTALLVPTRVGMILYDKLTEMRAIACPHTRGDDPSSCSIEVNIVVLSPHAWG